MAKTNMIGISGGVLSLACAVTLWFVAIMMSGFSPSVSRTDLEQDLRELTFPLAVLYTFGAMVGLISQLGAFLQLPVLMVELPIIWYVSGAPILYVFYVVGFLGASLLIMAMFIGYSRTEKRLEIPPFSRVRTWTLGGGGAGARPLPKRGAVAVLAVLCGCLVAVGTFTAYAWRTDVSELDIEFLTDGSNYGSVNITLSVDGEEIYTGYIPYDPTGQQWVISAKTSCKVPAGTHLVEVDAWNGAELVEGNIDTRMKVRTLPFTTQYTMVVFGIGLV